MPQFGGKNAKKTSSDSKRHFTVVMGGKEHGLYVSSTPSSAAKKAVTKLCAANKSKKVEFYMRETSQGSKKKTYGPYEGYIEKLKEPIELKGRVIKYKPVAKLSGKTGAKKRGMRGGGYNSTLSVNNNMKKILSSAPTNNTSIVFKITSNETGESINYRNIKFLGEGGYGKVFLVENEGQNYVIKITNQHIDYFLKEPTILNSFMNEVNEGCKYKAISQGISKIDDTNYGHIIFPYKGEQTFYDIIHKRNNEALYPKILKDIIICLIKINNYAIHGDIKLENIVFEETTNTGYIIDFGLSTRFPITIETLYTLNTGNKQLSVELIIGYLMKVNFRLKNMELYSRYLESIEKTIDNFGLFWIIIDSIIDSNIFEQILPTLGFIVRFSSNDNLTFFHYLNFYFNLDYQEPNKSNEDSLYFKLTKLFNYNGVKPFRQKFIDFIFSKLSPNKFKIYFNNDRSSFNRFIINVLALIKVDPSQRATKEELLLDPFFASVEPRYNPPPGPPPQNLLNASVGTRYNPPSGPPPQNLLNASPRPKNNS